MNSPHRLEMNPYRLLAAFWLLIASLVYGCGAAHAQSAPTLDPTRARTIPPPVGDVRCIWPMSDGSPGYESNGEVFWINPYATDEQNRGGVCRSWDEFWVRRVDLVNRWLESTGKSGGHDFERWCGNLGDHRRLLAFDEYDQARQSGNEHLYEGFARKAANYVKAGREVVAHSGCLDASDFADSLKGRHDDRARMLRLIGETYGPLTDAGVIIGMDAASAESKASATYTFASFCDAMKIEYQIESTPPLYRPHWKGARCRVVWPTFRDRHITQTIEPGKFAKFGTDAFNLWHPDIRVSLFAIDFTTEDARFWDGPDKPASEAKKRALLARMAETSRMLISGGCKVLIDSNTIFEARKLGVSVKEFYP